MTSYESELLHHQRLHAKWGVMHGPPYPLDRGEFNKTPKHVDKSKLAKGDDNDGGPKKKKTVTKTYKVVTDTSKAQAKRLKQADKYQAKLEKEKAKTEKAEFKAKQKALKDERKAAKAALKAQRHNERTNHQPVNYTKESSISAKEARDRKFIAGQESTKDINALSNAELKARTERLNLEQNYKNAMWNARAGRHQVKNIMREVGKNTLKTAATAVAMYSAEKLVSSILNQDVRLKKNN